MESNKYYLLIVLAIGLTAFLLRYVFYLWKDPQSKKRYLIFLALVIVGLAGYFLYLNEA